MNNQILIIDDDASFRQLLQIRLKSFVANLSVTTCSDLESARDYLEGHGDGGIDLVILDQHLPDGKGLSLLEEGWFNDIAVLSVSSDDAPEMAGASLKAGAAYFLNKRDISEPLFRPLVEGIIDRNSIKRELERSRLDAAVLDTVKTLVGTLQHEINNPLGAVLGAAYLLKNNKNASAEQKDAARLVESSGHRIKHVLQQLTEAMQLDPITKANHKVFHIPGDEPWEEE